MLILQNYDVMKLKIDELKKSTDSGNLNEIKIKDAKSFKILSLEGGGMKGLYAAKALAQIEKKTGTLIGDHFHMICGTSTGGLLALGITNGIPCEKIAEFYQEKGPIMEKLLKQGTNG